jgi:hypothetical protein
VRSAEDTLVCILLSGAWAARAWAARAWAAEGFRILLPGAFGLSGAEREGGTK